MQSDHDLKAIILRQGHLVPTLEAQPVPFQYIRKANPFLTVDRELDYLGIPGLFLSSGRLEGLLRHEFACGEAAMSSRFLPVFAHAHSVQIESLYGPSHVRWMDRLITLRGHIHDGIGSRTNLGLGWVDPCRGHRGERVTALRCPW